MELTIGVSSDADNDEDVPAGLALVRSVSKMVARQDEELETLRQELARSKASERARTDEFERIQRCITDVTTSNNDKTQFLRLSAAVRRLESERHDLEKQAADALRARDEALDESRRDVAAARSERDAARAERDAMAKELRSLRT